MTVAATTSRADYTGNGVTLPFPVSFYFLDNTHVKIILTQISTGGTTTLALTTDYTLTGAGVGSGGTATMVVAPTTDQRITILRNIPLTQLIHYVPNDPFPAATHEQALDQLTMEMQQTNEILNRALTLDASVVGASGALPAPVANTYLGWNSTGTGFQNYAGVANVSVSSAMQPVVQAGSTASARVLLNAAVSGANTDITSLSNVTVPTQVDGTSNSSMANTRFVSNATSSLNSSLYPFISSANTNATNANATANAATTNGKILGFVKLTQAGSNVTVVNKSPSVTNVTWNANNDFTVNGNFTTANYTWAINGVAFAGNGPYIGWCSDTVAPTASAFRFTGYSLTNGNLVTPTHVVTLFG